MNFNFYIKQKYCNFVKQYQPFCFISIKFAQEKESLHSAGLGILTNSLICGKMFLIFADK